jgi:hypothetical protein
MISFVRTNHVNKRSAKNNNVINIISNNNNLVLYSITNLVLFVI